MNLEFVLGRYVPVESPTHTIDPRIKIVTTLAGIIILFLLQTLCSIALFAVLIAVLFMLSRIGVVLLLRSLKSIWILLLLAFIFQMFGGTGKILFSMGPITITDIGMFNSIKVSSRLLLLIVLSLVFTSTTSPLKIADAVESLLRFIFIPPETAHEIAMIMTIAIRFIPVISMEVNEIIKAQKSRGTRFDSGGLIRRIKSFLPIIIPLLVSTFKRADELALAMDVRCYRGYMDERGKPLRIKYNRLRLGFRDLIYLLSFFSALILLLFMDRVFFYGWLI